MPPPTHTHTHLPPSFHRTPFSFSPSPVSGLCLSAAGAGPYVESISGANSFYPTRAGSNCPAYTYTSSPVVGYCFPTVLAAEVGDGAVLAADFLTSFEEIMDGAEVSSRTPAPTAPTAPGAPWFRPGFPFVMLRTILVLAPFWF